MTLESFKLGDFSGGVNFTDDVTDLDDSEMAPGTQGVEIVGAGLAIRCRRASVQVTDDGELPSIFSSEANVVRTMHVYTTAATTPRIIMSTAQGEILVVGSVSGSGTATSTQLAVGTGFSNRGACFEQMADNSGVQKIYMNNGLTSNSYLVEAPNTYAVWAGSPPLGTIVKAWKNMMLIAGNGTNPARLFFSAINNPESWPANNFIDIKTTDDQNDEIRALEVLGENLLVFKRNSVWLVYDPVNFDNRRIGNVGCVGRNATCELDGRVYWVATNGVYSTNGNDIQNESLNVEKEMVTTEFSSDWLLWDAVNLASNPNGQVALCCADYNVVLPDVFSGLWIMDTRLTRSDGQHPWVVHKGNLERVGCIVAAPYIGGTTGSRSWFATMESNFSTESQDLFRVFEKETGTDDVFDAIDAQYYSRVFTVGEELENYERLRRLNLFGQNSMSVDVYADQAGDPSTPNSTGTVNCGASPAAQSVQRLRPEVRGKTHQVRVSMEDSDCRVTEIELKYRGGTGH